MQPFWFHSWAWFARNSKYAYFGGKCERNKGCLRYFPFSRDSRRHGRRCGYKRYEFLFDVYIHILDRNSTLGSSDCSDFLFPFTTPIFLVAGFFSYAKEKTLIFESFFRWRVLPKMKPPYHRRHYNQTNWFKDILEQNYDSVCMNTLLQAHMQWKQWKRNMPSATVHIT